MSTTAKIHSTPPPEPKPNGNILDWAFRMYRWAYGERMNIGTGLVCRKTDAGKTVSVNAKLASLIENVSDGFSGKIKLVGYDDSDGAGTWTPTIGTSVLQLPGIVVEMSAGLVTDVSAADSDTFEIDTTDCT